MINTQYALCGKRVIQDNQENMISLIDIFEEINTPGFPVILPRISIVWVLERQMEDLAVHHGSVVFLQGDQQLQEFPVEINFQETTRTRCILVVGGMAIERPGAVKISFRIDGNEQAEYKFPVNAQAQQLNLEEQHPGGLLV